MPIDTKRFPMLSDPDLRPSCPCCDGEVRRIEAYGKAWWTCMQCDADERYSDAEMDERLQSLAEAAHERIYTQGL